ncbi:hypothetical protein N7528_000824 [Penicillium herquei]|nr:hypothetical protein N7528_000824 [Penicillium herquei]
MTTSSPNFGPLTTTFTPPADCFSEKWIRHNTNSTILVWGPTCNAGKIGYASSCYPSGWSGSKANDTNLNYKAFSPGLICPSGFTPTFSASQIQRTKSFLLSEYVTSLGKNDVATVCCPSGYDFNGDLCTSNTLVLTSRSIITVVSDQCTTKSAKDYNGVIGKQGETGDATFQAMPVILIRNTISDYLALPTSTNLSHFDLHDNGLSTGAKIAIGVCVPIGVIILSAIAFIVWHRRRRNKNKDVTTSADSRSPSSGVNGDGFVVKPELDGNGTLRSEQDKQELDTGQDGVKLDALGSTPSPSELPGNSPVELPVGRSPTVLQVELEGDGQISSTVSTTVREEEHRWQVDEEVSHDESDSDSYAELREMR